MNKRVEDIARVCHEANRAYCLALGDTSQLSWDESPEWQKESARKGVVYHSTAASSPQGSHESWLAEKRANGWVYGLVKDPVKKEHPCMVEYLQLPYEQRMKDWLFYYICSSFSSFDRVKEKGW